MSVAVLQAGNLDRRITLQRHTETRDAFNNPIKSWTTLADVWASKTDVRDTERVQSHEIGAEITTRFQIRYSPTVAAIDPKDRVIFEGRTYDVVAVKEIGRRVGLEISAAARAD